MSVPARSSLGGSIGSTAELRARHRGMSAPHPPLIAIGIALGATALGLGIAWLVSPRLETYTVLPSIAMVLVSAWYGGLWPGVTAAILSAVGLELLFVAPRNAGVLPTSDAIRLGFFILVSLAVSWANASLRRAGTIAEREAEESALLSEELEAQAVELEEQAQEAQELAANLARSNALLSQSEERFRLMVHEVVDYAIFALDPAGEITTWNTGAERIMGWGAVEVVGRHFSLFFPPADVACDKPATELAEALAIGRHQEEGWRVRRSGALFWADVVITPIHDDRGRHLGFTKVLRDLTERRRAEESLLEANRDLAVTTDAIAHDLRSPLRSLDGYSVLLARDFGERLDDRGREHLERIRANAQRMGHLIDGLLVLARLGRGTLSRESVDLSAMARDVIAELQRAEPARRIEARVADGLQVAGDPRLVHVVMQNLLDNAVKFTRERECAVIAVGGEISGDQWHCTVRDNGVGFDPDHDAQLFRPFQRLHSDASFEGTGIGLATVRRVIERHGGRVWAEGRPGAGAVFHFTLPRV